MLLCTVVIASSMACSDATQPNPEPVGGWTLVGVDGSALPATIDVGAQIVGGELELSADGTYQRRTRALIFDVPFQDWSTGQWSVTGGRISFRRDDGLSESLGTWTANSIEIAGVRTLRYSPMVAAPTPTPTTTMPSQPMRPPRW